MIVDFFTYSLTVILAFMGLLTGVYFANTSPDEAHAMKKYIPSLQLLTIILAYVVLFVYFDFVLSSLIFFLSFAFIYLYWHKRDINTIDYVVFASLLVISSINKSAHYYMTAIVFVFGILAGILYFVLHTSPKKHISHGHHKHSGEDLTFEQMSSHVLKKYGFFVLLSIFAYIFANMFCGLI
jgi:hypothetical protein